jgi:Skp family chaperone for outer membrane proteins
MGELKEIEQKAQKIIAEVQKERTDLMAKSATMNADAKYKEDKKIKDKERKLEEMQGEYQRVMHELETEMQMVQMRLQPFILEVIQNAQEVASKNPTVDAIWDNATKQFVYNKETLDVSPEVIKLTEKKNEQKTTLAKNKPAAPKAAPTKVA